MGKKSQLQEQVRLHTETLQPQTRMQPQLLQIQAQFHHLMMVQL